jgi:tetratricopeptide (TPR) repeat protein/transcriptional regulator with XRE-family HTH domain
MASIEIFAKNVRRLLAQRNIRIKDLAARIGLSESYLSLVLNGTRKNLSDEYKDRISSVLNVPLALLYSEHQPIQSLDDPSPVFTDSQRHELKDLIEVFLMKSHLSHKRNAFYVVLGTLSDRDAQSVRYFLSELLEEFARDDSVRVSDTMDLTEEEIRLLALISTAGDDARSEWVKAIAGLEGEDFARVTKSLRDKGVLSIIEDVSCSRYRVANPYAPTSSLFSQAKLRQVYRDLARAMELYPDEGPFFLRNLADTLMKAMLDDEAVVYFEKAAAAFCENGLYEEAADSWHKAAVIHGILERPYDKGRCLLEAAYLSVLAKKLDTATELAENAYSTLKAVGRTKHIESACTRIGAWFAAYDLDAAAAWYKRGLQNSSLDSDLYGPLLINLANISLQRGKLGEAENALDEARRWAGRRSGPEVERVMTHTSLLMGLIEYERRSWTRARDHFLRCIERGEDLKPEEIASALHNLGMIMYRHDDMDGALKYLTQAYDMHRSLGRKPAWVSGLVELAKVALREGKTKEAQRLADEALAHIDEQANRERGWVCLIRGCIDKNAGRLSEAADSGRQAVACFQREGAQRDLACAALWLSQVFKDMGNTQEERLMERRAFQIYEKQRWDIRELHRECSLLSPAKSTQSRGDETQ